MERLIDITSNLEHGSKIIKTVTMKEEDYNYIQELIYKLQTQTSKEALQLESRVDELYGDLENILAMNDIKKIKKYILERIS